MRDGSHMGWEDEEWRSGLADMSEAERDVDCPHEPTRNGRCAYCGENMTDDDEGNYDDA